MAKEKLKQRAIFLDRDGTIMVDSNYVGDVDRVILLDGAIEALRRLQDAGYRLFVITNQSGVGRGYFSRQAVDQIHRFLDETFATAGVAFERYYVCPHHPDDGCACRKPHPKHLLDAAAKYDLDLAASYMIGDRASDIGAGANAGTRTILVLTGAGRETMANEEVAPGHVAEDIGAAADWILEQDR